MTAEPVMPDETGPLVPVEAPSAPPEQTLILAQEPSLAGHLAHQWALATAGENREAVIVHTNKRALRGLPAAVRQVHLGAGPAGADLNTVRRLLGSLTTHKGVLTVLESSSSIVVPDGKAGAARKQLKGRQLPEQEWSEFVRTVADVRHRQLLTAHEHGGLRGLPGIAVLIEEAAAVPDPSPELLATIERTATDVLNASGFDEIVSLRAAFATLPEASRRAGGIDAVARIAELTIGSGPQPGDRDLARATFDAAMDRADRGDLADAVRLVTLGLRLVYHHELHVDGPSSLIVADPNGVLAPWRESRFGRDAADLAAARPAPDATPPDPERTPRVVVLAGAYGSFYGPVVQVLRDAGMEPDLLHPNEIGNLLDRRGATERTVAEWLRLADPGRWSDLPDDPGAHKQLAALRERLAGADIVFADWCDPGAVFAAYLAPPDARLIVRIHRVDATRPWSQLLPWRRVAHLILVSDHIRGFVEPQVVAVGRPGPGEISVVHHLTDVARYERPKMAGAQRNIAMVGWGRRVKDPVFAVEILRELLREDPSWRLYLIGRDFGELTARPIVDYVARFRELLADPVVRDAVVWIGFTGRLEDVLQECGFAVSTSTVESWHLGIIEAAVSGAIPVVRDWPQFGGKGGAREMFAAHEDWLVSTPAQAADRIRRFAHDDAWAAESERARDAARAFAGLGGTAEDYLEVILGPWRRPGRPGG